MTLRDLLKKRDKTKGDQKPTGASVPDPPPSGFTFIRSTTNTEELISPPSFASDTVPEPGNETSPTSKRRSRFRTTSNASTSSRTSTKSENRLPRLRLRSHSHASNGSSVNVPTDLPAIKDRGNEAEDKEAKWEERATILAQQNSNTRSRSNSLLNKNPQAALAGKSLHTLPEDGDRPAATRHISDAQGDVRR